MLRRLACLSQRPAHSPSSALRWLPRRSASTRHPRAPPPPPDLSSFTRYKRILFSRTFLETFVYTSLSIFVLYHSSPITVRAVNGASMAPTLSPELLDNPAHGRKDWVHFRRMRPGRFELIGSVDADEADAETRAKRTDMTRSIKRGQLVLLNSANEPDKLVVKRVVGLPGDVVEPLVRRQKVRRGEQAAVNEQGGKDKGTPTGCPRVAVKQRAEPEKREPVTVPFGHLWVEGDNAHASFDSNDYGAVSQSLVAEVAYGFARLPWRGDKWWRAWHRQDWENDGWEARTGMTSKDGKLPLRLHKRENKLEWKGDGIPPEWVMYKQNDV